MSWTLRDLMVLVETRGIDVVLQNMPEELYWQFHNYFNYKTAF